MDGYGGCRGLPVNLEGGGGRGGRGGSAPSHNGAAELWVELIKKPPHPAGWHRWKPPHTFSPTARPPPQGDAERERGLSITPLFDRTKQVGVPA